MFKKCHFLSRKNIFYFLLFTVFCCLLFIIQNNLPSHLVNRIPSNVFMNPYILPVGTQMVVPPWIMQQYQSSLQRKIYGNILDYLIYNYSVSAPSESGESTYYIPLSISSYDDDDDDDSYDVSPIRKSEIYMVDVTKVKVTSPAPTPPPTPATPPVESPSGDPPATPPVEPPLPAENGEVEKPADTPQASEEVQVTTTDLIDPSTAPPPPSPKSPKPDPLAERPPVSCEESDAHTEADSPCVECADLNEGEMNLLSEVEGIVDSYHTAKRNFASVIEKICDTCYGVDAEEFFQYIKEKAKDKKVPAEILFALIVRESGGECGVTGDSGSSKGLFQLNTNNSTCLERCASGVLDGVTVKEMQSVCEDGKHHTENYMVPQGCGERCVRCPSLRSTNDPKVCLNNPYCNFEEAFLLFTKDKWKSGNDVELEAAKDKGLVSGKNWAEMDPAERNRWRNAVVSYNGRGYVDPTEKLMNVTWKAMTVDERNQWVHLAQDPKEANVNSEKMPESLLNNWELKRLFFIKKYLRSGRLQKMVENLAHVESITGREVSGGFAESTICQWIQFEEKNKNLSCK